MNATPKKANYNISQADTPQEQISFANFSPFFRRCSVEMKRRKM
jgi:hypothetical protein